MHQDETGDNHAPAREHLLRRPPGGAVAAMLRPQSTGWRNAVLVAIIDH